MSKRKNKELTLIYSIGADGKPRALAYADGSIRLYPQGKEDPRAFLGVEKVTIETEEAFRAWVRNAKPYDSAVVTATVAIRVSTFEKNG